MCPPPTLTSGAPTLSSRLLTDAQETPLVAKFNRPQIRSTPSSPVQASPGTPSVKTFEGAPAWTRTSKSDLFMLGVTNFVGEPTFYEQASDRDARYARLISEVAVTDPEWLGRFLVWLRREGRMRSAPLVGALTAAKAMIDNGIPGSRGIVNNVLQRADEPGEAIACWQSMFGRSIPKPVKRGIADAATRLYSEFSASKYDTASHAVRFGDVLNLTHPSARDLDKAVLFKYLLDVRHGNADSVPEGLPKLAARQELLATPVEQRRERLLANPSILKDAAMTWESVAGWLQSPMDAQVWEALIPVMGVLALSRNLRNFDQAGVSDEAIASVLLKFTDPNVIVRSRMFPFDWMKAYDSAPSLRWGHALEKALRLSMGNIPELPGRTLILIDTSGSMMQPYSAKSTMPVMRAAALLGISLASKIGPNAEVHGFATGHFPFPLARGASVLRNVDAFVKKSRSVGVGTNGFVALRDTYRDHDRVIVITDMQFANFEMHSWGGMCTIDEATRAIRYDGSRVSVRDLTRHSKKGNVPVYFFNTNGYDRSVARSGHENLHELGGVTDQAFKMIPWIEQGRDAQWPF